MKKSLYLVAIAIGFGISCALWSSGFIFHPVYAPPPIVLKCSGIQEPKFIARTKKFY